jgi:hypothetical protein
MTPFTLGEIAQIRSARKHHMKMRNICLDHERHTRDEIVEAIDAIMRFMSDHDAMRRVNRILKDQQDNCLVNGSPVSSRGPAFTSRRHTPITIRRF